MKQTLHIFRKDVHYLWREIALLLVLAATLGWAETHSSDAWWVEALIVVAVVTVIARLIHAEAILGHNQFWITRPYRWHGLLGAKLLFILIFFNVPVFAAQWYMVHAAGFPFAGTLPGLVWSQVLLVVCLSLPVAALASMTGNMAQFLFLAFALLAAGFMSTSDMMSIWRIPVIHRGPSMPEAVDWIRKSLAVFAVLAIAVAVLLLQYRQRRTRFSQTLAIAVGILATLLYVYMPWSVPLGIETHLSKQAFDDSILRMTLDPTQRGIFPDRERPVLVPVIFPIMVSGTPPGTELHSDAMSIALEGSRSSECQPSFNGVNQKLTVLFVYCLVDPQFFREESKHEITLKGRTYLTLFGDAQNKTIPVQPGLTNAADGLRCGSGLMNQLHCSSAFRWPRRRVYAKFGEGGTEAFASAVSYSPFPAELAFNPIETHWVSTSDLATEATVITKAPLSHFRYDFQITGVRLDDYTRVSKRYPTPRTVFK